MRSGNRGLGGSLVGSRDSSVVGVMNLRSRPLTIHTGGLAIFKNQCNKLHESTGTNDEASQVLSGWVVTMFMSWEVPFAHWGMGFGWLFVSKAHAMILLQDQNSTASA